MAAEVAQPVVADPPEGFDCVTRAPFVDHVGPIYQWRDNAPGAMRIGLRVAHIHSNTMGFMHGGMTATLIDSCMGRTVAHGLQRRGVTLKMAVEYHETLNRGDWVEVDCRVVAHDADVAHLACDVRVGDSVRAVGTGIFRLLRSR